MRSEIPELDSITCPLDGVRMVEAAAGTGKTYNIQNLVLRLVLERGLPVSSILVVTFTEAATAELKSRIRDMLRNALRYADGDALPENELPRIAAILEHAEGSAPRETLIGRLRNAVLDFDDGSVSTIHGFCQRMLAEYAFESGGDDFESKKALQKQRNNIDDDKRRDNHADRSRKRAEKAADLEADICRAVDGERTRR